MKHAFIRTSNYQKLAEALTALLDPAGTVGPTMAELFSPAGRGKTEAVKYFAVHSDAVYVPPLNVRTPAHMLRDICHALNGTKPHATAACIGVIEEAVRDRAGDGRPAPVIIIDEADEVEFKVLEMLRNLNELSGCPILLVGENNLPKKIDSRVRLRSRIRTTLTFAPINQADVTLFFRESLEVDLATNELSGAPAAIVTAAKGDWRPVTVIADKIDRYMAASDMDTPTMDVINAALAEIKA